MQITCPNCESSNVERRGYSGGEVPKQRVYCKECNTWFRVELTYAKEPEWYRKSSELKELLNKDRFVVSSAQNNTPIDKKNWASLMNYVEYVGAQLLIIPVLYRNPTASQDIENTEAWWPKEVIPYLIQNEVSLCPALRLLANIRVQATAVNPLVGLDALSQGDSAIIGHPQIQMRTVATPQNALPKMMMTTGSVSVKNYSNTKAGIKGNFHHSLGALIVEKENNKFHVRNLISDNKKEFYDLDIHATPKGIKKNSQIEALITGDSHAIFHSKNVKEATFDAPDSIVKTLNPKVIARHDLIDSYAISHHHRSKPTVNFKKWIQGTNSLENELKITSKFLEDTTPNKCTNVVIASNHHEHISRWLEEADPKQEPWNAILYHELMLAWLKSIEKGEDGFDPFVYWMKQHCQAPCVFVKRNDDYIVKDVLLSMHGDKGPNGSRGSLNSLAKMGIKSIVGHSHSPAIEKGCFMVGTSSILDLEYAKDGPSSWLNTHAIIHPNGKRQLIHIIGKSWRSLHKMKKRRQN